MYSFYLQGNIPIYTAKRKWFDSNQDQNQDHFSSGYMREYCNWETFQANCTRGHTIMMTTAKYGRMKFGRCIPEGYRPDGKMFDIGCAANIIR